jgi:hypothetical protein
MTENTSTVPVRAADLRVGDIVKWPDGRNCVVDNLPEPSQPDAEYGEPLVAFWATETNADTTRPASSTKFMHASYAVLDVLEPRPSDASDPA